VPADHNAVSQAVDQMAKSAIRGSRASRISGRARKPWAAASSKAPRIRGRATSNSRQISCSGRRCSSRTGSKVRKIARSAKSGRVITSSREGATGQAVFCGRCTTRHEGMDAHCLAVAAGVKGRSPRERVAEGEPLRPLPQPSYTQNAVRRRPWFRSPVWLQSPFVRHHHVRGLPRPCISFASRSSPFIGCGTDAAEPHIRSPYKRLTPKFLILEVIGLGRAEPIFITACCSQDVMRSARREPARAIASCGWRDASSGR
jgi:hypothetical protein